MNKRRITRRDFMKIFGATAATVGLSSLLAACEKNTETVTETLEKEKAEILP